MNRMEEARKQYEEIMIPPELSVRVQSEIEKAEKRRRQTAVKKLFHHSLAAAAAAVVLFTAALNTSVTFAHAAEEIPVIGMVAKVLTFRSYETKTEDYSIAVDIPSIEMISGDFKNLEQSVNSEIHRLCELYAEESIEKSLRYTKELRAEMESKESVDTAQYLTQKNELLTNLVMADQRLLEEKEQQKQIEEKLKNAQKEYHKVYEKYRAMLKARSVTDMSARTLLAFGELKQKLYKKYVTAVEKSFFYNFHRLISKTDLINGIYISSSFEVVAYRWTEIEVSNVLEQIQQYGEEYVRSNIGERAYQKVIDSDRTGGKMLVPVKVEQHFSAGEKQIFVMALYQALAEIRTAELPFVIDTPLARIDSRHRKNILSFFFSQLPGQVIILSTDEEIDKEGLELLSDKLSDIYLIEYQKDGTSSERKDSYFEEVSA